VKTEEIDTNGFNLYDHENHELDMALLSLKIGLVAYFSTNSNDFNRVCVVRTAGDQSPA
jgi:hypothetical protein